MLFSSSRQVALATYHAAVERWPNAKITLRNRDVLVSQAAATGKGAALALARRGEHQSGRLGETSIPAMGTNRQVARQKKPRRERGQVSHVGRRKGGGKRSPPRDNSTSVAQRAGDLRRPSFTPTQFPCFLAPPKAPLWAS